MLKAIVKTFFGNWSLEQKCLLFLGVALLGSLLVAFFAVQYVAEQLVMETARQSARDSAKTYIGWKHIYALGRPVESSQSSVLPEELRSRPATDADSKQQKKLLEGLKGMMFESKGNQDQSEFSLFRLNDGIEHESLHAHVAEGFDQLTLENLQTRLAEKESMQEAPTSTDPNLPQDASNRTISLRPPTVHVFEETGPYDGFYYYYHPVQFDNDCMECHLRLTPASSSNVAQSEKPFRVIRVKMSYGYTRFWSIWIYSILTTIAIFTLALSLFFVHWILKRLVIRPVVYMKQVSEQITAGDTARRFQLETNDEFHDLSESFNAMLRHLTNIQSELQTVNSKMNIQVDELARVNLELFEANRLKGEFLANMSHELRTPLNSILGFSDVLQGFETLTEKQRRYVSNIQSSGRNLLEMINDILDLAKVEAGKMQVRVSEFDLLAILHSQCDLVRKLAEDKNIDVRIDSGYESLPSQQDQAKIQQILTNLLSNAIKFTPEGGLITVSCELKGDDVLISVADTGVGIAIEDHEIIFEKFRQAKQVTGSDGLTREHSGTGLGLSIVRELCRLLGGDIGLSSQVGFGSTFRVKIPRNYSKNAEGIPGSQSK
jgi:two-component system sensor histidine kinase BarA